MNLIELVTRGLSGWKPATFVVREIVAVGKTENPGECFLVLKGVDSPLEVQARYEDLVERLRSAHGP